jgi:hypothetical protein
LSDNNVARHTLDAKHLREGVAELRRCRGHAHSYLLSYPNAYLATPVAVVKRRITVTLEHALVKALDARPGASRSKKIERLLAEALAARAHRRWVTELRTFYKAGPDASDRQEDLDWHALSATAFERDD